jgi:hypothetical protein
MVQLFPMSWVPNLLSKMICGGTAMMTGGGHEMAVDYVGAAVYKITHHIVRKISNIFDKLPHPFSHCLWVNCPRGGTDNQTPRALL